MRGTWRARGVAALALMTSQGEAVERFLNAATHAERSALVRDVLDEDPAFDDLLARLKQGRSYASDVPRGRLLRERTGVNGVRHPYMILVPEDYTPDRRYPVRFDLHGGMGAPEWRELDGSWSPGWTRTYSQIVVVPAGWWDSMWWEWSQVESFEAILRDLGATYNVDEDRVVLYGNSDGGAALYFHAMRRPDRYAGYAGHVAPPDRLVRAELRPDGQCHVPNLAGQRFHLGFGERDPKVPIQHLRKYLDLFQEHGAFVDFYVLPGQRHSLRLTSDHERRLFRFLMDTRRDPLPDHLSWATERTDRYARRSWLVIDELKPPAPDAPVDESILLPRWGIPIQLRGPTVERVPWGQVVLTRDGNRIEAQARGVARFTLLISPDELDLSEPIHVRVNGRTAFEGLVEPSIKTLLEWAARDDDRSRLFAAELSFEG